VAGARAVLLDLDGTLSDSRPGIAGSFRYTLTELGHDPSTAGDLTWAVGPPIAESIRRLLAQYGDDRVERAVAIYRARYSEVGLYDCALYPNVVAMLEALRVAGWTLCLATSKRRDFAERVVAHLGIGGALAGIYGAEPGGGLDDKADLLAHILAREPYDPAATIMLGDRLHDVHAARTNRLRCIGALWGYGGEAELRAAGADLLADAPAVVPALAATA